MSYDKLQAELRAVESLTELLQQAQKCLQLHEEAGLSIPDPLRRILNVNGTYEGRIGPTPIHPPERPPMPPEAHTDWVWIQASQVTLTTIVLAILRKAHPNPVRNRDIVESASGILEQCNTGSIPNIGARLHGNLIRRTPEGWVLIDPNKAPILYRDFVWGPAEIFDKKELAIQRREAVLYLLSLKPFSSGLQTSQIIELLRNCPWVKAPVNKELVQDDVELLSHSVPPKIRRRGNSKKWELVENK